MGILFPLSFFILAMEGLHAFICKAEDLGLFTGASIGRDNVSISHLMYTEDVIFFINWFRINAHNLICMLHCFFFISGLKINVLKSNVIGIGVSDEELFMHGECYWKRSGQSSSKISWRSNWM